MALRGRRPRHCGQRRPQRAIVQSVNSMRAELRDYFDQQLEAVLETLPEQVHDLFEQLDQLNKWVREA